MCPLSAMTPECTVATYRTELITRLLIDNTQSPVAAVGRICNVRIGVLPACNTTCHLRFCCGSAVYTPGPARGACN